MVLMLHLCPCRKGLFVSDRRLRFSSGKQRGRYGVLTKSTTSCSWGITNGCLQYQMNNCNNLPTTERHLELLPALPHHSKRTGNLREVIGMNMLLFDGKPFPNEVVNHKVSMNHYTLVVAIDKIIIHCGPLTRIVVFYKIELSSDKKKSYSVQLLTKKMACLPPSGISFLK